MPTLPDLSVILPAFNEQAVISGTLNKVIQYTARSGAKKEIIVVNDGSTDKTKEIVEAMQKEHPEIKLINHASNLGYGQALRSGFNGAVCEWLFLMDSDGQFDINELDALNNYAKDYDLIIGWRKRRADAWHRRLFGFGYTLTMNILFGMRFKDIDCAFKLFRKSAWQKVQPITSTDHKIFTVEWLWRSKKSGLKIKEIPVSHYPRQQGKPTGARPDVVWQMFKALWQMRFSKR